MPGPKNGRCLSPMICEAQWAWGSEGVIGPNFFCSPARHLTNVSVRGHVALLNWISTVIPDQYTVVADTFGIFFVRFHLKLWWFKQWCRFNEAIQQSCWITPRKLKINLDTHTTVCIPWQLPNYIPHGHIKASHLPQTPQDPWRASSWISPSSLHGAAVKWPQSVDKTNGRCIYMARFISWGSSRRCVWVRSEWLIVVVGKQGSTKRPKLLAVCDRYDDLGANCKSPLLG